MRLKICCISSLAEARLAIDAGAHAIGLVSAMPSGPGPIDEALIAGISAKVPPGVSTFLLTSRTDAEGILAQLRRTRAGVVQLVDSVSRDVYAALRDGAPSVRVVQVIHVRDDDAVQEALEAAPHVDALLLDSGNPTLAVKELGGTGRVHDWRVSRAIRDASPVPVWLAGGLRADNVAEAIAAVEPFGLDVCSGVRTDGRLDPAKLESYVEAVRSVTERHPPLLDA